VSSAPPESDSATGQQTGCYVYGILPGDVELVDDVTGVGDREVKLVRTDALAALASEVDLVGPIGTPEDLQVHQRLLDLVAAVAPVLPLRFGAVLNSEDAVRTELLEAHQDEFIAALQELEGRAEFMVKGRYDESALLEEILSQDPEAASLREQIRGKDADATRQERMQLGEIISNAVSAQRDQDTQELLSRMSDHSVASLVRDPTHELDAVNVAFLLDGEQEDELNQVVEDLRIDWDKRVELRVLGPMAPYDFVIPSQGTAS
jgi:Gas vesicle synthesis protein GvpL/GvpF